MGKLVILLLGILFCGGLAYLGVVLVGSVAQAIQTRKNNKAGLAEINKVRGQLDTATMTLIKIASEDAGNPALEARLALEDISRKEITR